MSRFLTSNERQWRLSRTIAQDVLVANVDLFMDVAVLDPTWRGRSFAIDRIEALHAATLVSARINATHFLRNECRSFSARFFAMRCVGTLDFGRACRRQDMGRVNLTAWLGPT